MEVKSGLVLRSPSHASCTNAPSGSNRVYWAIGSFVYWLLSDIIPFTGSWYKNKSCIIAILCLPCRAAGWWNGLRDIYNKRDNKYNIYNIYYITYIILSITSYTNTILAYYTNLVIIPLSALAALFVLVAISASVRARSNLSKVQF